MKIIFWIIGTWKFSSCFTWFPFIIPSSDLCLDFGPVLYELYYYSTNLYPFFQCFICISSSLLILIDNAQKFHSYETVICWKLLYILYDENRMKNLIQNKNYFSQYNIFYPWSKVFFDRKIVFSSLTSVSVSVCLILLLYVQKRKTKYNNKYKYNINDEQNASLSQFNIDLFDT